MTTAPSQRLEARPKLWITVLILLVVMLATMAIYLS
jgi:hypothetical protein